MFSTKLINVLIAINMKSKQYKVYNLWETLINIYIYKIWIWFSFTFPHASCLEHINWENCQWILYCVLKCQLLNHKKPNYSFIWNSRPLKVLNLAVFRDSLDFASTISTFRSFQLHQSLCNMGTVLLLVKKMLNCDHLKIIFSSLLNFTFLQDK